MADALGWRGLFVPEGYVVVRVFAEHTGGCVGLARSPRGDWVALKVQTLPPHTDPDEFLARKKWLQEISTLPGLLPIHACGLDPTRDRCWEELELVDGLDGQPIDDPSVFEPSTLRREVIEQGRKSVEATIAVGETVCGALEVLHKNGLVHRDVKPGNFFRLRGQVVLGDYGLTAPPGAAFDFKGTEGFMPSDGGSSFSSDLFALGKSLYEIWSGCDRLEFPTLPKSLLESADWDPRGAGLNEILLRACSPIARDRYATAAALASDLNALKEGRYRSMRRRTWLRAAACLAGGLVVGGLAWLGRPQPPRITYTQRKRWDHLPENWSHRNPLVVDAKRGCAFSLLSHGGLGTLYRVDLSGLEMTRTDFNPPSAAAGAPVLNPEDGSILFVDRGLGRVWRLDPDSVAVEDLGGEPLPAECQGRGDGAMPYWNPMTRRLGCFGGYGHFEAHNFRWEFEPGLRQWINIEPNNPGRSPWCRKGYNLLPIDNGRRLLLVGGHGNVTGKQGQRSPGFRLFDGLFHYLGDVWTLDLLDGRWSCAVPAPGLETPAGVRAFYLQASGALVAVVNPYGIGSDDKPPSAYVLRLGRDREFVEAVIQSDAPVGAPGWPVVLPAGDEALMFSTQGVFSLSLET